MQIVFCDDESNYLSTIQQAITRWASETGHTDCVFTQVFQSSEDLLEAWENGMSIDLLFLDIQIPGELSGMEVAKIIHGKDEYIPIVFITNYSEYAYEGYSVNALRYLRKPILYNDLVICLEITWRQWVNNQDQFLSLSTANQSIHVPVRSIIYAESIAHTIRIASSDEIRTYEIRCSLEYLEKSLPNSCFVRCHKSYIVSLRHIRKYKKGVITVSSGIEIPVGRKFIHSFTSQFRLYYQGSI